MSVARGRHWTRQMRASTFARIDEWLAAAVRDKSKLLSVKIWPADITTFEELNAAWVDSANHRHARQWR
jgi:enamine deaminase RidA (YjgF/YER057c/UK114 family)